MENSFRITNHAKKRIRERSAGSSRQAELALTRGISSTEFAGSFKRYLDKLLYAESFWVKLIIYANDIYVFDNDNNLITILKIPTHYLKYVKKGKENV